MLERAGLEVVAKAGDADELVRQVHDHRPAVTAVTAVTSACPPHVRTTG